MRHLALFTLVLFIALMINHADATTYLQVQGPVSGTLHNNGSLYLGKVGPGESFYVLASAATTNATGAYVNIGWDTLTAVELPRGWSAQSSPLYENPMKMKITTAASAPNGAYKMILRAVNIGNYSKLGNLTFTAYINLTTNVFNLEINPTSVSVGSGQPANLYVTINNTGASDDPFIINAQGLPAWNVSYEVIAPHSNISTFVYPVYEDIPGVYNFNLTVGASTTPLVYRTNRIRMIVQASLLNDYSAVGQGVVLSPVIYEPAYAIMLLLRYMYTEITRI